MRRRASIAAAFVSFLVAMTSAEAASKAAPPGTYTFEEAIALGILNPDDFTPPPGMETCPPWDPAKAAIQPGAPPPPHNAPRCFSNPADLADAVVIVREPEATASAGAAVSSTRCDASLFPNHRLNGSCDP